MNIYIFALFLLSSTTAAFIAPRQDVHRSACSLLAKKNIDDSIDRRSMIQQAAGACATIGFASLSPATPANAANVKKVVVAGATGQTGRRVLERLASSKDLAVVGAVRNVEKASKDLETSSTVVRGAMVQSVESVDTSSVSLQHLDVVADSVDVMTKTLAGADGLVIAVGFVPGNPLKMNAAAHEVDNVGTCRLIDAAKAAGVKKIVMVSSILTNGREWGQEKSPGKL